MEGEGKEVTFRNIPWEEVAEAIKSQARIAPIAEAIPNATGRERFELLRRLYADPVTRDPRGDPYFVDWLRIFTPIEMDAWCEIRCCSLPFLPQFPACGYFLDFADPEKRIALETDGKEWHDRERDRRRDQELFDQEGWRVYRVTGRECRAQLPCRGELVERGVEGEALARGRRQWMMDTVDGVCYAIRAVHYEKGDIGLLVDELESLNAHRLVHFPIIDEGR